MVMTQIAVFAKLVAQPGRREELLNALEPFIRSAVEDEPGTEVYAVHLDPENGDALWFYEIFTDKEALEAHGRNEERLRELGAKTQDLLVGPVELSWGRVHLWKSPANPTPT
jgi:quinol monooxygenase YgiN